MNRWIVILFLGFFLIIETIEAKALTINIFSVNNGKGLELSRQILKRELERLGHVIIEREAHAHACEGCLDVDLNIYFEIINPRWMNHAAVNWFIPNPEWYLQDLALLDGIDLIVCRTHEVERIFSSLNKRTHYIGFSSRDCFDPSIKKDYHSCLHVAGSSRLKGTKAILKAWKGNAFLTPLTILVQHWPLKNEQANLKVINKKIPAADLHILQNANGIHLCPSEVEGYGHYLMEAMSTGAIVITTDGPPMNEFIEDNRCLVPYVKTIPCRLGTRYLVDPEELAKRVQDLKNLSPQELQEIGERNRKRYLQNGEEFHQNLKQLMLLEFP